MEVDEWGIVKGVLEEIGDIGHLIAAQTQTARETWSARVGKARRQRTRGAGHWVLWHTGVEVFHHVSHICEGAVMEEEPAVLELPHRRGAELEGVAVTAGNLPPSVIDEVGIISRQPVQGLDRVV